MIKIYIFKSFYLFVGWICAKWTGFYRGKRVTPNKSDLNY